MEFAKSTLPFASTNKTREIYGNVINGTSIVAAVNTVLNIKFFLTDFLFCILLLLFC